MELGKLISYRLGIKLSYNKPTLSPSMLYQLWTHSSKSLVLGVCWTEDIVARVEYPSAIHDLARTDKVVGLLFNGVGPAAVDLRHVRDPKVSQQTGKTSLRGLSQDCLRQRADEKVENKLSLHQLGHVFDNASSKPIGRKAREDRLSDEGTKMSGRERLSQHGFGSGSEIEGGRGGNGLCLGVVACSGKRYGLIALCRLTALGAWRFGDEVQVDLYLLWFGDEIWVDLCILCEEVAVWYCDNFFCYNPSAYMLWSSV
jgi:hypothetical protein